MANNLRFKGTEEDFERKIKTSFDIAEIKRGTGQVRAELEDSSIILWAPSTGKVWAQGPDPQKKTTEGKLEEIFAVTEGSANRKTSNKVFVVYGHDESARRDLDGLLRRWQLEPVILDQLPSEGQTIIEKLERYCLDEEVKYAIVLATPDDEGHRVNHPDEKVYRARQNVVLELGMMLAKLGRKKVAVLIKGQERMERPSDIQGLIYIPFKDNLQKEVQVNLAKEMNAQGFEINIMDL
jgi:predicted nucleotide-binding protein